MRFRPFILLAPALVAFGLFVAAFATFVLVSFSTAIPGTVLTAGPATLANYRSVLHSSLAWDSAAARVGVPSIRSSRVNCGARSCSGWL